MNTRTALLAACALTAVLASGACSSSTSDAGAPAAPNSASGASGVTSGAAPRATTSAKAAADVVDFCSVLTTAEVGAVVGGTVTRRDDGLGSCIYSADEIEISAPTIADLTKAGGGYEAMRSGSTGTLSAKARILDGVGDQAYVVAGKVSGFSSAQAGASASGHVVLVTMSPGRGVDLTTLGTQAEAVLRLAVGKL